YLFQVGRLQVALCLSARRIGYIKRDALPLRLVNLKGKTDKGRVLLRRNHLHRNAEVAANIQLMWRPHKPNAILPKLTFFGQICRHRPDIHPGRQVQMEDGAFKEQGLNVERELTRRYPGIEPCQAECRSQLIDFYRAVLLADELWSHTVQ